MALFNRKIQFSVLIQVTKENYELVKLAVERISLAQSKKTLNTEGRHVNLASKIYPRFFIKDGNEAISFITSKGEASVESLDDIAIWTDSPIVIYTKILF